MKKSKLVHSLRTCSPKELTALKRFVASPYFNRQTELSQLLAYLLGYWPHFEADALQKTHVFEAIWPNLAFDGKRFRYFITALEKLVERFWAIQKMEQTGHAAQLALLESASARGAGKVYKQANRRLKALTEVQGEATESSYFLEHFQWSETNQRHFARAQERRYDDSIQHQSNYLDRYYFLEKLKLACAMLDRRAVVAGTYEIGISAAWSKHLTEQSCFDEPLIRLYYETWLCLQDEQQEAHFHAFKARLEAHDQMIALNELRNLYHMAINYCARKIRQGQEAYIATALDLYLNGLQKDILLHNGELSPWAFTNIVKLAMRLQRYEWGEAFLHEYAPKLPAASRENALRYNLAELFYYTGRRAEAQQQLQQVAFSDLNYYLGARVLLAKLYYEEGAEEALLSLIASFIIFLKRNRKISTNLKHTYLNFCDILFQLVRRSPKKLPNLGERIQQNPLLTDRNWLLEQWRKLTSA